MRSFASALLSLPVIWSLAGRAEEAAGDQKPAARWTLFAECRMAGVPQRSAISLIADFGEPELVNAAWDHLERMLEGGQAMLEADLIVQGVEGKSMVAECVEEMKYPSEYDPPRLPQRLSLKTAPEVLKVWPFIGVMPTDFAKRNVGESIELKARVLDDGAWIAISVEAIHSRLEEQVKCDFAELPGGEKLSIQQPRFSILKSKSSFRVRNGEKILLGVHKLAKPEKTFELFVLQVKATRAGDAP